jgi:ActR/RegA family two-component response regulator
MSATRLKKALIVDPDLARATALHNALTQRGCETVIARDLPTALLMMTASIFDLGLISSKISEPSDGWSVAAVLRALSRDAHIAVIAPERSVTTIQATINSQADQLFDQSESVENLISTVWSRIEPAAEAFGSGKVAHS